MTSFDGVLAALAELARGRPVIVADDQQRENEGDVVMAAQFATKEWVGWTIRHTSGFLCVPMTAERAERLQLPLMITENEDRFGTAYTVSVDAAHPAVSTGISAADRALTIRTLAGPDCGPKDLIRPGHILPLIARGGGVLERPGHTESAVDLTRLAGLEPVGMIAELVDDQGDMLRGPQLERFAREHGLVLISIRQIAEYRRRQLGATPAEVPPECAVAQEAAPAAPLPETPAQGVSPAEQLPETPAEAAPTPCAARAQAQPDSVTLETTAQLPTAFGNFTVHGYCDGQGNEQLALIAGPVEAGARPAAEHTAAGAAGVNEPDTTASSTDVLVRLHSECLTGEAFHSRKCECGAQLDEALRLIGAQGGILIYLRGHEGRGIGLLNKLRAYQLQETGLDTLDANLELGFPADARDYRAAGAILHNLGVKSVRLLTNNPQKVAALQELGIIVSERIPLQVGIHPDNQDYVRVKGARMGHQLEISD